MGPSSVAELGQSSPGEQEEQLQWPRETLHDASWWPHKAPVMLGAPSHAGRWLLGEGGRKKIFG